MNTSRQISNRNRQLNLTQDISSSFNPYIFSKHDRAFHHRASRSSFHHRLSLYDRISRSHETLGSKIRGASSPQRSLNRTKAWTPKETPGCSLREGGPRHHTRIQGAARKDRTHNEKGRMERVYTFHSDKSARNRRILLAQHLDLLALHPPSSFLESSILLRSTCSPPPGSHDRV